MKKIIALVLTLSLAIFPYVEANAMVSEQIAPITEKEKLLESLIEEHENTVQAILLDENGNEVLLKDENGLDIPLNVEISGELMQSTNTMSSSVQNDIIAITATVTIPQSILSGSGQHYEEGYDASYGVKAYSTYYYSTDNYLGITGTLVTQVSGGWQRSDSTISLSSRHVRYGCSGANLYTGAVVNQVVDQYPTSDSFNYNTGFNTYILNAYAASYGVTTWITLSRGSSSWQLNLFNSKSN